MTDKELLELAAKASGIALEWGIVEGGKQLQPDTKCFYRNQYGIRGVWNPLTDDGDALRLAVKLRINIEWTSTLTKHTEEWISTYPKSLGHLSCLTPVGNDQYVSTRIAIVNAAAEIGKEMP